MVSAAITPVHGEVSSCLFSFIMNTDVYTTAECA